MEAIFPPQKRKLHFPGDRPGMGSFLTQHISSAMDDCSGGRVRDGFQFNFKGPDALMRNANDRVCEAEYPDRAHPQHYALSRG
jgi:hypothetical protein